VNVDLRCISAELVAGVWKKAGPGAVDGGPGCCAGYARAGSEPPNASRIDGSDCLGAGGGGGGGWSSPDVRREPGGDIKFGGGRPTDGALADEAWFWE
jgi:hypothetical protein